MNRPNLGLTALGTGQLGKIGLYTFGRDYFRGRIDDLSCHGLTPVLAIKDFPQEYFLKTCAVLTEKAAAPAGFR